MIELEEITVARQGRTVLSRVSLSVGKGDVVALVGPSGSGKSTVLRAVLGLDLPVSGKVSVGGRCLSDGPRMLIATEDRNAAMVFQDLALWPHLSVQQNLEFGLKARGYRREDRAVRVQQALGWVDMLDKRKRSPGELSGGERQRVAIARALVLEPAAILLDEPLANLDVALKKEILGVLSHLLKARDLPAIYVTHDPWEAVRLANRTVVLEAGRVVQAGSINELVHDPATPFVRQFAQLAMESRD